MTERDKVKQKVVKLLSKTRERGASEAEAVAAAEVTELMAQFDIAASELEIRSVGSVEKIIAKRRYGRRAIGAGCAYMVSQICDCMAWHKPNSQTFFGLPHDVEIAAICSTRYRTVPSPSLTSTGLARSSNGRQSEPG